MTYVARSKPQGNFIITVIEVCVFVAPVVVFLFGCIYFRCFHSEKQKIKSSSAQPNNEISLAHFNHPHSSSIEGQLYHTSSQNIEDSTEFSVAPGQSRKYNLAGPPIQFNLADIKAATNNFEALKLGEGGFGIVYKGELDIRGTNTQVAIKRWNGQPCGGQGFREFQCEINHLSAVRHRNLVSLIGHCEDDGEMILVYEYMPHGTLRSHLYKTDKPSLPWKTRLRICIGAARGLHYLHTGPEESIIHRDVKSNNILVDANWEGRIADFGIRKTGPPIDETNASVTVSDVRGTSGYLDPEYFRRQRLTKKSDVYSFGVVLLEAICARAPIDPALPSDDMDLSSWARRYHERGKLDQKIDPRLKGQIAPKCFKTFADVAMKCLAAARVDRPSMEQVVFQLMRASELQEEAAMNRRTWAKGYSPASSK